MIKRKTPLRIQLIAFLKNISHYIKSFIQVNSENQNQLVIALVLGLTIRCFFLYQPLRYDEAFSFMNFARNNFISVFNFPVPNNHVFHSLLMKFSTLIWGNQEPAIRLPALFSGIIIIHAVYLICNKLNLKGILAILGTATFPLLIFYSTNARGYMMIILFSLWMIALGLDFIKSFKFEGLFLFAFTGALGIWTMLAMIIPLAGIYLWLGILFLIHGRSIKWILMKFIIPSGLIMGLFSFLFYSPVIVATNGVKAIIANDTVKSIPWQKFISQLSWHYQSIYTEFTRNIPILFIIIILLLFMAGLVSSAIKKQWSLALLFPLIAIGSSVPFYFKHSMLLTRTWLHMIPLLLIVADSGYTFLINKLGTILNRWIQMILVTILIVYGISLVTHNAVARYPDTGRFAEAPIVANFLKNKLGYDDVINTEEPVDWTLHYYLWRNANWEGIINTFPTEEDDYFIVQKHCMDIKELTNIPVIKLLDYQDMQIYQRDPNK